MVKYVVLLFAAGAVFSPLFLIGIRRYTGQKAKRALRRAAGYAGLPV